MSTPTDVLAGRPSNERPRLDALTGLRFVVIAYIVCYHVGDAAFADLPAFVDGVRRRANVLMPLFFVLSGFVLTYRYLEPIASGRMSKAAFWHSRLTRIVPVYVVALGLQFAVDVTVNRGVPPRYVAGAVAQALAVQAWIPPLVWFGNPPGWTVSVEVFFYFVFPWLVVLVSRASAVVRVTLAASTWLIGQSIVFAYVRTKPDGWPLPAEPAAFWFDLLRYLPPMHLPSFLIGIVAALAFSDDLEHGRRRPGHWIALVGAATIAAVLSGGLSAISRRWVPALAWSLPFTHDGLMSPAWALVVFGLAHAGRSARVLSARPLVRLGNASYGLYILHFPVYDAVATWFVVDWDQTRWFLLQFFVIMLPLSVWSFERFEQPVRAALLERFRTGAARAQTSRAR